MISRRELLKELTRLGVGASFAPLVYRVLSANEALAAGSSPAPAQYWTAQSGGVAHCDLCPNDENLRPGQFGRCHVRQCVGGKLVTHGYDQPSVLNVDPIEKNPLAHVMPASHVLSIAHSGCNLRCLYCQNWQFSQVGPTDTKNIKDFSRQQALAGMKERKLTGVVFTYTEAGVSIEFTTEIAALAKSKNLLTALCTAGYINPKPFADLIRNFDAVTITFKGPTEKFYDKVCAGEMKAIQDSMLRVKADKKWLEVATLIVPSHNDEPAGLKDMAGWIVKNLGPDTPWHLERFMPMYKLQDLPQTPQATMEKARQIGQDAGLKFVYISNLAPHAGNHTYCPNCHKVVITRLGFKVLKNDLKAGRCCYCQTLLPGIWA